MPIFYRRGHTLTLLELPLTLRFAEFPAAILQLAGNAAPKHSIPALISRQPIYTSFNIDTFCIKSEITAWEVHSINNISLSFFRQEPYETSKYTMTLLTPNSDQYYRDVPSSSPMNIPTSEEGIVLSAASGVYRFSSHCISLPSPEIMMLGMWVFCKICFTEAGKRSPGSVTSGRTSRPPSEPPLSGGQSALLPTDNGKLEFGCEASEGDASVTLIMINF